MWYSQLTAFGVHSFPIADSGSIALFSEVMLRTANAAYVAHSAAVFRKGGFCKIVQLSGEFGKQVACRRCILCVVYLAFCNSLGLYGSSILYSRRSDVDGCSRSPSVFLRMPSPQSVLLEFSDVYHNVTLRED
ncbi:hypothetical protein T05_615 [Trichinella murrelli]|uniref:Uncharacterized protein n=1 Tax=Trichinella murrelli TaxID=144512 RepID=A0A0V0U5I6_9BILA|nr:hypothetical protein T05_615 [Trichinella murrelli]